MLIPEIFERDCLRPLLDRVVGEMGGVVESVEYNQEAQQIGFHAAFDEPPDPEDVDLLHRMLEADLTALTEFLRRRGKAS